MNLVGWYGYDDLGSISSTSNIVETMATNVYYVNSTHDEKATWTLEQKRRRDLMVESKL